MSIDREEGLRAPPGLSFWGKAWWWFHFLILIKLARLRFIAILVAIGLIIVKWDTLTQYYLKWTRPAVTTVAASPDTEYYCPMHPTVVRDTNKEKCPICFMPLSRRKKGTEDDLVLPPGIVNRVQLSPYRIVQAGIRTWDVSYVPLVKDLNTVGFVEFNERSMKQVAARVKGRIDRLEVSETGQMVHAGQELASLYSPDLQVTVQNLIDAQRANNPALLKIARDRLVLWGIDDQQIQDIVRTGKAPDHLQIRSPMEGHVLKKYVKEGQYVEEGMPLYDVVDLSTVWIQAQVWEEDMAFLPTANYHDPRERRDEGLPLEATTRAFPGEAFAGKLNFVFPHVDLETRTVVIRFELENPGHKLRPGTSVNVKVKVPPARVPAVAGMWQRDILTSQPLSPVTSFEPLLRLSLRQALLQRGLVLAIPEGAIIDTGAQKIVYREHLPGTYEGVRVELGPRLQGPDATLYYPVLSGLNEGDRIVTAGSFLVDAETRLNPAAGSIYFGGSSGGGKTGGATTNSVKPSTPDDEDALIRAAFARIPGDRDRQLAIAQKFCPVNKDSRLGSMGVPYKMVLLGQPVFLCCKGCEIEAVSQTQETVTRVEKLRKGKTTP